jgi:DNA-binding beta-propeller fold protein YncE
VTIYNYTFPQYVFVTQWGNKDSDKKEFEHFLDIAVDSRQNVYVISSIIKNNIIRKFDSNGKFLIGWGDSIYGHTIGEFNIGEFICPKNIAIDIKDDVYVSDYIIDYYLQKFDSNGNFLAKWGNQLEDNKKERILPYGITVDPKGYLFIADHRCYIYKFNSVGNILRKWKLSNKPHRGKRWTQYPKDIAVDSKEYIYVVCYTRNTICSTYPWYSYIQKLDSSGELVTTWGSRGSREKYFEGNIYITIDVKDNIYVADCFNNCIQKFDSKGKFITTLGRKGSGYGEFLSPTGIAVDLEGNLYVADSGNHRIQKFAPKQ